ncbi:MAG TPA: ribose 5-phosphate isomerase B [bacterium]|nr:ribose 5-phosphate isomerase B [bacterium]HPR88538.1 ribose 5-phosphate isomerase B [bacterium]
MSLALASDHAGYALKQHLRRWLDDNHIEYTDFGCYAEAPSVDYADFSWRAATAVSSGVCERGVVLCGTGIGAMITANKVSGIRAALCVSEYMAEMARRHNNANILALGGRTTDPALALGMLRLFLETPFDGGRHLGRVQKIHRLTGR